MKEPRPVCPLCGKRGVRATMDACWCVYCHSFIQLPDYKFWEVNLLASDVEPLAKRVTLQDPIQGYHTHVVHLEYRDRWYRVAVFVAPDMDAETPQSAEVYSTRRRPNLESVRKTWRRVASVDLEQRLKCKALEACGVDLESGRRVA